MDGLARAGRNGKSSLRAERWASRWALAGAAAWAALAILARMGVFRVGVIELLFLFGPLVVVPLGMELGRVSGGWGSVIAYWFGETAQMLQPLGAALAVVAMWLPPGKRAGLVSLGWMVICGLMAAAGAAELGSLILRWLTPYPPGESRLRSHLSEIAACVARLDLAVGGAWLVTSRFGVRPMGIQEPIGLLTAVHFHFAGFATAMIASTTLRCAEKRGEQRWLRRVVMLVISLPVVVAAGFVISPALKMAAAVVFSGSVAGLALFLWAQGGLVEDSLARKLLRTASAVVLVGMALSATYAVADFVGSDLLPIPRMATTHGVINAVGFCLFGLLGWLIAGTQGTQRNSGSE